MPFALYRQISDDDVNAMVAYLRTMPPVVSEVEASRFDIGLPPAWGPPVGKVAAPDRSDPVAYGRYLAGPVGHCVECHTPGLEDGRRDFMNRLGWEASTSRAPGAFRWPPI